jgi:hypothetical protein
MKCGYKSISIHAKPSMQKGKVQKRFYGNNGRHYQGLCSMTHFRKKMCVAVQRTQLWMQEDLEIKSQRQKTMKKKLRCKQEISLEQPQDL